MLVAVVTIALLGMGLKGFRSPTTAVVDIHEVFEAYQKKKDLEATLKQEMDQVNGRLQELRGRFDSLRLELEQLQPGSEAYLAKMQEKNELELTTLRIQQRDVQELSKKFERILRELRDEIAREIQRFAEAHNVDLVLERQVIIRPNAKGMDEIRWPVVHFASPDLDITSEVTARLNSRYASDPSR